MEENNGKDGNGKDAVTERVTDAPKADKAPGATQKPAQEPPIQAWGPQPQMPPQGYQQPPPGYQQPPPGYYPPPPPMYYPPPPRLKQPRVSNKPKVVGSLLVVVAVLGLGMAIVFGLIGMAFTGSIGEWFPGEEGDTMTVTGRVTSLNGTAVPGAVVQVVDEALSGVTDEDGYYIIYNVPIGDQTIRCEKEGYTTVNRRVTVMVDIFNGDPIEPGQDWDQTVNFALTSGSGEVTTGTWMDEDMFEFGAFWMTCMVIMIVASVLSLMGAFFAFKRTNLMFVLVGTVAGIFTVGFFIGSVLAFIALFILLLSLDEFRQTGKENAA